MLWTLRILTFAGMLAGAVDFAVFAFGYPRYAPLVGLWAVAPFPLAYVMARWLAPGETGLKIAVGGFAATLIFITWAYADAIRSFRDMTESLSGLVVIFGPVWQYVLFALALLAAWFFDRRSRMR